MTTVTVTESNTTVTVTSPGPQGPAGSGVAGYHGSFFSTATQSNSGANQVNTMTYNQTDTAAGVSIVTNSKITIASAGVYNMQFSAQFAKDDSGDDFVDIWLSKNNDNISWSNSRVQLSGNNAQHIVAWNWFVTAAAGDYFEIRWSSADTEMSIDAITNLTDPTRPDIPSIILTVSQVQ